MVFWISGMATAFLALATSQAQAGKLVTLSVELKRSAQALEMLIGDDCLCDDSAAMTPSGQTLVIRDIKRCANDLKKLAINWQNEVEWAVTSIPGTTQKIAALRHAMEKKLGPAPNRRLRFLSDSSALRCLVFATPEPLPDLADGTSRQGNSDGQEPNEKRPRQPLTETFERPHSDRGLYTEPGSIGIPSATPST